LCCNVQGFSLQAAHAVSAHDREGLERLWRYGLTPLLGRAFLSRRAGPRALPTRPTLARGKIRAGARTHRTAPTSMRAHPRSLSQPRSLLWSIREPLPIPTAVAPAPRLYPGACRTRHPHGGEPEPGQATRHDSCAHSRPGPGSTTIRAAAARGVDCHCQAHQMRSCPEAAFALGTAATPRARCRCPQLPQVPHLLGRARLHHRCVGPHSDPSAPWPADHRPTLGSSHVPAGQASQLARRTTTGDLHRPSCLPTLSQSGFPGSTVSV